MEKTRIWSGVSAALVATLSVSLICWYFLPGTIFEKVSLIRFWETLNTGSDSSLGLSLLALFLVATQVVCCRPMFQQRETLPLAAFAIGYSAVLAANICLLPSSLAEKNDSIQILAALTIGVFVGRATRSLTTVAWITIVIAAVQAVYSLVLRSKGVNLVFTGTLGRSGGTFDSPTRLYTLMLVALPLALTIGARSKRSIETAACSCIAALVFCAMVLTWSRGAFFACGISTVWLAYTFLPSWKTVAIGAVVACSLIAVGLSIRSSAPGAMDSSNRSITGRFYIAQLTFESLKKHPFGQGVGNTSMDIVWPKEMAEGRPKEEKLNDPRSLPLLLIAQFGVGGILLYVGLLWGLIRLAVYKLRGLSVGFVAGLIALFAAGVVDITFGSLWNPVGNAAFGLLLGSCALIAQKESITTSAVEELEGAPADPPRTLVGV